MEKNKKYPDALIADLSGVFALKDSNAPGYLSGPKLTHLFNGMGFPDTYKFPDLGIVTPEVANLSRTQYALKRLTDLNDTLRIPEALTVLMKATGEINAISDSIARIFDHYKLPNPLTGIMPDPAPVAPVEAVVHETVKTPAKAEDSVFDSIPPGVKVAFFSYSWDNEDHKKWVLKLANDLAPRGIYVLLDQYLPGGYPLTYFMNKGLDIADRVIIIGTPKYQEKSIKSLSGGVTYEESIIHVDLMRNIATTKFLPIVRSGTFETALPPHISTRIGFDFRDDSAYDSLVEELVREIYNVPKCARPTLGPVPTFSYNDLTPREQEALKSPDSDFRKSQDRKWLDRLLGGFSFYLMDEYVCGSPDSVDERVFISIDIWNSLIGSSTFRIYDPTLRRIITEFHKLWLEAEKTGLPYYSSVPGSHMIHFHGLQHDLFTSDKAEEAFNKLSDLRIKMRPLLHELATYIMDNFEIDVEETSLAFIKSLQP